MGTVANIPATVTESSVLVIGIRVCSSSIAHHGWLAINRLSLLFMSRTLILRITPDFFQLEREGLVYQFDSVVQETGHEAIDVERKCHSWYSFIHIPWKTDNFFILLFEVIWLAPSWLSPISTDLEISNKSQCLADSSNNQTSTDSKALCVYLKGMSGRAKRLQKFMVITQATNKHEHYNYQKLQTIKYNFSTAPTSLLQAYLFLSTFVCPVTKPRNT